MRLDSLVLRRLLAATSAAALAFAPGCDTDDSTPIVSGPPQSDVSDGGAGGGDALSDVGGGSDVPGPDATDGGVEDGVELDGQGDAGGTDGGGADGGGTDGGGTDGGGTDGGGTDGGPVEPPPSTCDDPMPPLGDAPCEIAQGVDDGAILMRGTLVTPSGLLEGGYVLAVDGWITCAGCDCAGEPEAAAATQIVCPGAVISPGLINAHDHITFTQMKPVPHGDERYDHRHEWRKGLNGKLKLSSKQNSDALGDGWGELRQAMAGTTSLFGSGGENGVLRNLDKGNQLEGLAGDPADYDTFPLGDSSGSLHSDGCGGYDVDGATQANGTIAYVPHVAEGIADTARNEFLCLSGLETGSIDQVQDDSAFIHGIGLLPADVALMAGDGASLVWSPRSNTDLYGMTADVPVYKRLGVRIGLGTDWTASGSVTMLRELVCAEHWAAERWGGFVTDAELIGMATDGAADVLGFSATLGALNAGKAADIAIWDARVNTGYRAILDAEVSDVVATIRGGTVLYGEPTLVETLRGGDGVCETLDVCGVTKRLCAEAELGISAAALETQLGAETYGLFFCGVPDAEPSCYPLRPDEYDGVPSEGDADGDGIPDVDDNCPQTFNPPRPVDGFGQGDVDADGEGDVCDPCPLTPDTTACESIDPTDIDGDGWLNSEDNCPGKFNDDQLDGDDDGAGDACDPCPGFFNPGGAACPTTVWDVKTGVVGPGQGALLQGMVVTAQGDDAVWFQADPAAEDYEGLEYSAIYAYAPGAEPLPLGAKVDVEGSVNDYFGQIQLNNIVVTVVDAEFGALAPTLVDPADVAPGGALEQAYEALFVQVLDAEVLDVMPTGGSSETVENEFLVTGGLTVDDQLYLTTPWPSVGQVLPSIVGVLRWNWERNKLLPRFEDDIALGAPTLLAFETAGGASEATIWEGASGATAPALTVRLTHAPAEAVEVAVESAAPETLAVLTPVVTIAAGETTGAVEVEALAVGDAPVVLTASYEGVELTAEVSVLAADTVPAVVSLEPAEAATVVGAVTEMTATLDVPAPPGGLELLVALGGDALDDAVAAPETVTVPAGTASVAFEVGVGLTTGTLTVTVGTDSGTPEAPPVGPTATLEVLDVTLVGLVLVEVFYNPDGQDGDKEWVKLYNGSGAELDLAGYSLGWGGSDYTYGTAQLSGTVPDGACFIVGGPTSEEATGSPVFDQAENLDPDVQNSGSTADGLALFDVPASSITPTTLPIDAVIYGDANANALLGPDGGAPAPHVGNSGSGNSLVRTGIDTWDIQTSPNADGCIVIQ